MRQWLFAVVGAGMVTLSASGQPSPLSDWMRVWDPDGKLVASIEITEADEILNGPAFIYVLPVLGNPLLPPTLVLEPGVIPGQQTLSDIFGVVTGTNGIPQLAFASDVDGVPFPFGASSPFFATETGGPIDATMYLDDDLRTKGWTAAFWSDPGAAPEVSATFALLGLSTLLIGFARRRLR